MESVVETAVTGHQRRQYMRLVQEASRETFLGTERSWKMVMLALTRSKVVISLLDDRNQPR